ncbi:DUF300-domain-containing protein [Coniophora puteana RWD-64-598 SS2]|uniref:DUF300-domain-containing protein n=1 Tax=Coniophora puteana (strain RWD-64-598) TaxID=741705 RepID=A0A5M3M8A6_CONPW|nr:DUF300-domain-containing protein [Coniophora puteana RWD-64-598 SS2]EIW75502.1 DUF300-domain-containing protein [Coniophora puteana RWD-64-598 SS2]
MAETEGILPDGRGAGSSLPLPALIFAGLSTLVAVVVSGLSIYLQLKNYRKPMLQRMVVRIMVMVPIYAIASLISIFSLDAAFFIDAIRDIYEAFVIYCFFALLIQYLGGERELLILLHGRPPKPAVFPMTLWRHDVDASDPYTYLFLKRGILQYVQVKPMLAVASLVMKATGTYHEGDFRARSGYLYVSVIYNVSICLALYCLAVFWMCVNEDLKPFRPVPKFLCVKGILFFSFWQSIGVSLLVAAGLITRLGPYTDSEHISIGLTDMLICIEMPFFAAAHMYAFSYKDFTTPSPPTSSLTHSAREAQDKPAYSYVARLRIWYALRDSLGLKDLVEDTRATLRGEGLTYRSFEPSEGVMHVGVARETRIRAGLRYVRGGKGKYWLPEVVDPAGSGNAYGLAAEGSRAQRQAAPGNATAHRWLGKLVGQTRHESEEAIAPLLAGEAEDVVHDAPDMRYRDYDHGLPLPPDEDEDDGEDGYGLEFAPPSDADEELFRDARRFVFGDYLYPVVDVSSEEARRAMWEAEVRVVQDVMPVKASIRKAAGGGYGATGATSARPGARSSPRRRYEDEDEGFGSEPEDRVVDFEEGLPPPGLRLNWTRTKGARPVSRTGSGSGSASGGSRNASSSNLLSPPAPPHASSSSHPRVRASSAASASQPKSKPPSQAPSPSAARSDAWHNSPALGAHDHVRSTSSSSHPSARPSPRIHTSSGARTPLVQDDAVDLIVPDSDAASPPPPALRRPSHSPDARSPPAGLRRVWHDEQRAERASAGPFVIDDGVGDNNDARVREEDKDEEMLLDRSPAHRPQTEFEGVEGRVVREQMPPSQVQAGAYTFVDTNEENPWA